MYDLQLELLCVELIRYRRTSYVSLLQLYTSTKRRQSEMLLFNTSEPKKLSKLMPKTQTSKNRKKPVKYKIVDQTRATVFTARRAMWIRRLAEFRLPGSSLITVT